MTPYYFYENTKTMYKRDLAFQCWVSNIPYKLKLDLYNSDLLLQNEERCFILYCYFFFYLNLIFHKRNLFSIIYYLYDKRA